MLLTRRELLTAFFGAPFALAACRSGASDRFPDGEIMGQTASLGHVLRENRNFDVPQIIGNQKKLRSSAAVSQV
jgi:hypothetical protein